MVTTFKGRIANGVLTPVDGTKLPEGKEVVATISTIAQPSPDWLDRIAGSWADIIDCDRLERDIYESRLILSRPAPEL